LFLLHGSIFAISTVVAINAVTQLDGQRPIPSANCCAFFQVKIDPAIEAIGLGVPFL